MKSASKPINITVGAILALTVGLFLIYLSTPRMMASILLFPGDHILDSLQNGKEVPIKDMDVLIASREDALQWVSSGEIWGELGLAQSWKAYYTGYQSPEGREQLSNSIDSFRQGLALAPANTFAWAGLAYSYVMRTGYPVENTTQSLKLSILTSPYQPKLLINRLTLCLKLFTFFDDEGKGLVEKQIKIAAKMDPKELAKIAAANNEIGAIISNALEGELEEHDKFNKYYEKLVSGKGSG